MPPFLNKKTGPWVQKRMSAHGPGEQGTRTTGETARSGGCQLSLSLGGAGLWWSESDPGASESSRRRLKVSDRCWLRVVR